MARLRALKRRQYGYAQVATALALACALLFASVFSARLVRNSSLYLQSQLYKSIFSQESPGIASVVSEPGNIDLIIRFVGAVTSAYINFELIPVNEAGTFTAIFECINKHIAIDKFEYRRKDIVIYGTASSKEEYALFLERLRRGGYFESVSGSVFDNAGGSAGFEVLCVSAASALPDIRPVFRHTVFLF